MNSLAQGDSLHRLNCNEVRPSRPTPSLLDDVRDGLLAQPRTLPPKYFYDDHGSRLFDAICDVDEYYPTRTEDALLEDYAQEIIATLHPKHVIELGSGAARKTRHLFDACEKHQCHSTYWPFDVCESIVRDSSEGLIEKYKWLNINGLVGDYHAGFDHFPNVDGTSLYVFLGGTIGNFEHDSAIAFLSELRETMQADDRLLIGADRVKDTSVLNAAYNDSNGITAEFNLNVLRVLNRELGTNFNISGFEHKAYFNKQDSQIEMHLVSNCQQTIKIDKLDQKITLGSGESIRTEISRKFTPDSLTGLLKEAGFALQQHFQPENGYFSLMLAGPEG